MTTLPSKDLEIWLAVNEDGDFEVNSDGDEAVEQLRDNWGYNLYRLVKLNVRIGLPVADEVSVNVPDNALDYIAASVE